MCDYRVETDKCVTVEWSGHRQVCDSGMEWRHSYV